ncbi:MAG: CRISPR-associated helicase Cas3' [Candidatus Methanomethyliaceae archaeon]
MYHNKGILTSSYQELCARKGWIPRVLIKDGFLMMDEFLQRREPVVLLLDLPTAYGKTTITTALAMSAVKGNCLYSRVIHVLPMRSIADQLGAEIKNTFKKFNCGNEVKVAIQHLGLAESPFFAKKVVITTLDTFLLNFFKAPVAELEKLFEKNIAHFEFSRGLIYSAMVVFDEFHLFSPLGTIDEEVKSLTSATYALLSLAQAGVPIIIMTATMPDSLKNFLIHTLKKAGVNVVEKTYVYGCDPNFEQEHGERKIHIDIIDEALILDIIKKYVEKYRKKVMVVHNTPEDATKTYRALSNLNPILLHGKLPEWVRKDRMAKIDNIDKTPPLLIATQVVESGLNLSFDVLISDICPADRLVQRAGRVARRKGHNEGFVFLIRPSEDRISPYSKDLTWNTLYEIEKGARLNRDLINKVYKNTKVDKDCLLWDALYYLDNFPQLDAVDSKKIIECFRGFTNSFGIVSGFMEKHPQRDWAVGLSENEAKSELDKNRRVVQSMAVKVLNYRELQQLLSAPSLAIWLQYEGYDGIVVEEFDPQIGFIRSEPYG